MVQVKQVMYCLLLLLLLFSLKKRNTTGLSIHLGGTIIESKEHAKFLGIIVDEKLSQKYYINYVKT